MNLAKFFKTKSICFILILFFFVQSVVAQVYTKESSEKNPELLVKRIIKDKKNPDSLYRAVNSFYITDIRFFESNDDLFDGFAIEMSDEQNDESNFLFSESIKLHTHIILTKLLFFKYFKDKKNKFNPSKVEYLSDMFAGYYYGYTRITTDWHTIQNNINSMQESAEITNRILDWYDELFKTYKPNIQETIVENNHKRAFLTGIYLSMPKGYRKNTGTGIDIGNDKKLLIKELLHLYDVSIDKESPRSSDINLNQDLLIFEFIKDDN